MPFVIPPTDTPSSSSDACLDGMWPQGDVTDGDNSMWNLGITDGVVMWPTEQWPYCIYLIIPFDGCVVVFDDINYDFSESISIDFNLSDNFDINYSYEITPIINYEYSQTISQLEFQSFIEYYIDFEEYVITSSEFNFTNTTNLDFEFETDQGNIDIPINIEFEGIREYNVNFPFNINYVVDFAASTEVSRVDFCYV